MINQKISTIASLINDANVVVDIGCDHCWLAVALLKNKLTRQVINVDINEQPLLSGINNLKKNKLLSKTINLVNDGLKNLSLQFPIFKGIDRIDFCVIAGIGGKKIIEIIGNNNFPINCFILHPTKNEYQLREFLLKNKFEITKEIIVKEDSFFYPIIVCEKTNKKIVYAKEDLYFGKINNIHNHNVYFEMLLNRYSYLEKCFKNKLSIVSNALKQEYTLLQKRIKAYETK